jgi:hypothetical protein
MPVFQAPPFAAVALLSAEAAQIAAVAPSTIAMTINFACAFCILTILSFYIIYRKGGLKSAATAMPTWGIPGGRALCAEITRDE